MKKKDRSFWFCVDYRQLNSLTQKVTYPLLKIGDTLDALAGRQRGSGTLSRTPSQQRRCTISRQFYTVWTAGRGQCMSSSSWIWGCNLEYQEAVGGRPAGRLRHSISAAVVGRRELASRMSTGVQPRHALAVAEATQLGG
ncbi:hypothetical protein T12_1194 [Trichinella patagoniensis]|uniref:Transposon Ty3-I Gag-Pol polyprotein n=1 Tax=Trichinella patagoniensis TaxID=990121 RepID=A0A0V0Z8U0_9BILA|nr:hypothetical protein T12_1194 [Trichinella patagoniensis]